MTSVLPTPRHHSHLCRRRHGQLPRRGQKRHRLLLGVFRKLPHRSRESKDGGNAHRVGGQGRRQQGLYVCGLWGTIHRDDSATCIMLGHSALPAILCLFHFPFPSFLCPFIPFLVFRFIYPLPPLSSFAHLLPIRFVTMSDP